MKKGTKLTYPYKLARLSAATDLLKQWVVVYYVWSIKHEKLIRKRVVVKGNTAEVRQRLADEIISEVNQALKSGAVDDEDDQLPTPVVVPKPTPVTNLTAAVAFFLQIKANSLKRNSLKTYRSSLKQFTTYLTDKGLSHLRITTFTPTQAFAYMDYVQSELRLSNKSYNKHLGTIETLFNFYVAREQLEKNPFVAIKPLPERPGKHTAFSPEQISRIRDACALAQDEQLWLFLNFIYFTFARPQSELRLLRVGDLLPKTIRIDADNAKNNRTGFVQIPPPLERLIERHELRSYSPHHYVFTIDGTPGEKPAYEKYFYNQHRRILTLLRGCLKFHEK